MNEIMIKYKAYLKLMKEKYLEFCSLLSSKMNVLKYITDKIGVIDVTNSGAQCVISNRYCKPEIVEDEKGSFLDAKGMRHPIIERIRDDIEYIPNDIFISYDNSKLIYGLNSSGKSCLSKSVILTVIMAQAGFYVPCESFKYCPYKSIIIKTSSEDNIFMGVSSYIYELKKIKCMVNSCNNRTLIFADELCNSTEHQSAIGMFGSTVKFLSDKKSSFIFTTHLHDVKNIKVVKELIDDKKIELKHLETDTKIIDGRKVITYARKLLDGPGKEIYGLEVANYIGLGQEFMHCAYQIRDEYINNSYEYKQSNYNKDLYLRKCAICGNNNHDLLHTHHINEQSTADDKGFIGHYHKNKMHNLLNVCNKCHHNIHNGKILVKGYKDTNDGKIIDWERCS